jgi:hypothetical protein
VAVHEAGHALARYLTAHELGFETSEAIVYIEVAFEPRPYASLDGKAILSTSAITYGPMYSRAMIKYLQENPVSQDLGPGHPVTLQAEVDACKDAGIDVVSWARLKALVCMAGPAAEAKFTARPVSEVVGSYECENDVRDGVRGCLRAGMTSEEAQNVRDNALDSVETYLRDPRHWRAVLDLAQSLPAVGRLQGQHAAAIIARAATETA